MRLRFEQWRDFLDIDAESINTLREFSGLIRPHMDTLMDAVYAYIHTNAAASATFTDAAALQRARAHQKHHWQEHVFAGNFNQAYLEATLAIGRTHQRLGVDLRFYSGAYVVVLNQVVALLSQLLDDNATRTRYLTAINRAIFLDMGLATYAYYDTLLNALEDMAQEVTLSLARAGEYRDNETGKHITRMSKMCEQMALALGKDATWAHALRMASPLHDVGKIGVPDRILLKPGRLDEAEYQIMREHPRIGGTIIPEHPALVIRMARRIALTHHEKWDGSGYPAGLCGEEIPLEGRIAAICDVYDALVSARPYKPAWTQQAALDFLQQESGHHFDPHLVETFLRIVPEIESIQSRYAEESC
ncbi:HD domain-containing phosphohydrolase [Aquitalea sp.]|uniref:HD domain-containing phosphohydrolase n=1 Tax=Aquitalea sp. TaxID=1872623 RepID=UPI00258D9D1B|nr:HD domain-containing phosphohydrolase [Aquitalea sp.]